MNMRPSQSTGTPQTHTRIIDTLLGNLEKRALLWLAARMPAWVVPDTLTIIGLAASLIIFFGYALTFFNHNFLWLASLGFVLQWFGDSLDGTLARYRKIERPRYGFFVDHIIDAISEALIFIGVGFSPYVRFDLALVALIAYLLLSIYVYLVTYVNGVFRISYAGLGPTEFRLVAIIANGVVYFTGNPASSYNLPLIGVLSLTFYDLVAIGVTLILVIMFVVNTMQTAILLSREDRAQQPTQAREVRSSRKERGQRLNGDKNSKTRASHKLAAK